MIQSNHHYTGQQPQLQRHPGYHQSIKPFLKYLYLHSDRQQILEYLPCIERYLVSRDPSAIS